MLDAGIGKHALAPALAAILGCSKSNAYKKLSGDIEFFGSQIELIEKHFNTKLLSSADKGEETLITGVLRIGQKQLPCKIELGDALEDGAVLPQFVATLQGGVWVVIEAADALGVARALRVQAVSLVLDTPLHSPKRAVAILDDNRDSADSACLFLEQSGLSATKYYDIPSIFAAMRTTKFDGFVLDWQIGNDTSEVLIQEIRRTMGITVPIILLTGGVKLGQYKENEAVQRLETTYRLNLLFKPLSMTTLTEIVTKALGTGD